MDAVVSQKQPRIVLASERPFTVGHASIDPISRDAEFEGGKERLQPQNLKVLIALTQREGCVVTRDELVELCWDARYVGDDVIHRSIFMLRQFAQRAGGFEIETIPRAGYRLIEAQDARAVAEDATIRLARLSVDARPHDVGFRGKTERVGPRPTKALAAAAAIGLVGVGLYFLRVQPDQSHPPLAAIELAPFVASGGPLATETAKASDAVVADMLANSGLPVIKPTRGSAEEQNADLRLSGQMQSAGDSIEATLQLDDLRHGTLLLSRRFSVNRTDAKNLPEQIGAFAATSLASTGAMMALDRQRPGDRRLTGEVLRQWSMGVVFEDAIGTYQAVDRIAPQMPDSAIAQLGLAMSTVHALPFLALQDRPAALAKGRAAAARARILAPNYGDVAWPDCKLYSPVRMAQCEAAMRKAFAIDPGSPFVAAGLRNQLVDVGRFHEALDYDRLAVAAMPYMAGRLSASIMLLEGLGLKTQAEQQFQRVRHWWPEFDLVFANRIEGMLDRGNIEEVASFVAAMPPGVDVIDRQAVSSIAGDISARKAQEIRARCLAATERNLAYFCLVAMIRADDMDGAFVLADRLFPTLIANDPKEEDRLFLETPQRLGLGALSAPALAPLRKDPRFIRVAERVGLFRYWRQSHLPDFCTVEHESVCGAIVRK
jgi:DNA-binding winged helix-turn-helix (wHTH) protein